MSEKADSSLEELRADSRLLLPPHEISRFSLLFSQAPDAGAAFSLLRLHQQLAEDEQANRRRVASVLEDETTSRSCAFIRVVSFMAQWFQRSKPTKGQDGRSWCPPEEEVGQVVSLLQFAVLICLDSASELELTREGSRKGSVSKSHASGVVGAGRGNGGDIGPSKWVLKRQSTLLLLRLHQHSPSSPEQGGSKAEKTPKSPPPKYDAMKNWRSTDPARIHSMRDTDSLYGDKISAGQESACAESVFRFLLEDALVLLSHATAPAAASEERPSTASRALLALHYYALVLLAAALLRFEPITNTVFLNRLFPVGSAGSIGPQHPILFPLAYHTEPSIRWAAALTLQHSLEYLGCFYVAEELKPRANETKKIGSSVRAFVPLSVQSGVVLSTLHARLKTIAEQLSQHRVGGGEEGKSQEMLSENRLVSDPSTRSLVLELWGTLVSVTPYSRCPSAMEPLEAMLRLPLLRYSFGADSGVAMSDQHSKRKGGPDHPAGAGNAIERDASAAFLAFCVSRVHRSPNLPALLFADVHSAGSPLKYPLLLSRNSLIGSLLFTSRGSGRSFAAWRCMTEVMRFFPSVLTSSPAREPESLPPLEVLWQWSEECREGLFSKTVGSGNGDSTLVRAGEGGGQQDSPAQALAECLRCWSHFMGSTWQPFDGKADDPALAHLHPTVAAGVTSVEPTAAAAPRATLDQTIAVFRRVLQPVWKQMRKELEDDYGAAQSRCQQWVKGELLGGSSDVNRASHRGLREEEGVWMMALRCAAQVGDACVQRLIKETGEVFISTAVEDMVTLVDACAWKSPYAAVRAEAFNTIAVWFWSYPSLDRYISRLLTRTMERLMGGESSEQCLVKAAFALSNLAARLPAGCSTPPLQLDEEKIGWLCEAAAHAASGGMRGAYPALQHHGIRIMRMLFEVLTVDACIAALEVAPDEVVAECFLNHLLHFLSSSRDPKLRWNAATAVGVAIHREEVFEAEPENASKAILCLTTAVKKDPVYKVKLMAVEALAKVFPKGLRGEYSAHGDYCPDVLEDLCLALQGESAVVESGGRPSAGDGAAWASASDAMMKVKSDFRRALIQSLEALLRVAHPSETFQSVMARYGDLLQKGGLL